MIYFKKYNDDDWMLTKSGEVEGRRYLSDYNSVKKELDCDILNNAIVC